MGLSGYVNFGTNSTLQNLGDEATVSAWVNVQGDGIRNGIDVIQEDPSLNGGSFGLVYLTSSGKITFSVNAGTIGWHDYPSQSTLSMNTWYNVVGVYDGASGRVNVYINGVLDASYGAVTGDLYASGGEMVVGMENSWDPYNPEYLDGAVAQLGIWQAALNPGEITQLYAGGNANYASPPESSSLVAYYPFDEGVGATIVPSSLASDTNDGSVHGGARWITMPEVVGIMAALPAGAHDITAVFTPAESTTYSPYGPYTSNSLTMTVVQPTSSLTTDVTSSYNYGDPESFTATLIVSDGLGAAPSGAVDFYDGPTYLGSATIDPETATTTYATVTLTGVVLPLGDHAITAYYEGDDVFPAAASPIALTTITPPSIAAPTLTITGDASVDEGTSYALHLGYAVNAYDVTKWLVNWGDGTSDPITSPGNSISYFHTYKASGDYIITATATESYEGVNYSFTTTLDHDTAVAVDTSFGTSGVTGAGAIISSALQPDGSVVAIQYDGTNNSVIRLDSAGNPDGTTFDNVDDVISGASFAPAVVAIQNKVGDFGIVVADSNWNIVRYNSDGTLDTSFGTAGLATASGLSGAPSKLLTEADGSIILVGLNGDGSELLIAQFDAAGQPTSYGAAGISTTALAGFATTPDAAIQPGNQVVAAVSFTDTDTTELFRFTTSGSVDSSTTTSGTHPRLAIEPDGRILLAANQSVGNFTIVSYLPDGSALDSTFTTATGPFADVESLAIAPSGKIIAAGVDAALTGANDWALAAFNADGSNDDNFGTSSTNEFAVSLSGAASLAVQPDGKLLLGGQTNATDAFFARYSARGLGVHVNSVPVTDLAATASATTITENDSISLSGTFSISNSNLIYTVDISWGDGSLDTLLPLGAGSTSFEIPAHQFTKAGSYSIQVSVLDVDSVGPSVSIPITVNPMPSSGLTLSLDSQSLVIGNSYSITGTFDSAGTGGTRTITLDWGDGTAANPDTAVFTLAASALTFTVPVKNYTTPGEYEITARVADGNGRYEPVTTAVAVAHGPVLTVSGDLYVQTNQELSIPDLVSYVDANYTAANGAAVGATIAYSILWDDGAEYDASFSPDPTQTPASGTISGDHTYTDPGDYTVTVMMSDSAGSGSEKSFTIHVTNPGITIANLDVGSQPPGSMWAEGIVDENDVATVTGNVTNLNGKAYTIDVTWGDGNSDSFPMAASISSFAIHHYYTTDEDAGTDSPQIHIAVTTSDQRTASIDPSIGLIHSDSVAVPDNPSDWPLVGQTVSLHSAVDDPGEDPSEFTYLWTVNGPDGTTTYDTPNISFPIIDSTASTGDEEHDYTYGLAVIDGDDNSMWTGGTIGYNPAVDDNVPTITIAANSVIEGQPATVTITLNNGDKPLKHMVTFDYYTQDDTAKAGKDYDATNGPIEIRFGPSDGENITTKTWTFPVNTFIDHDAQSTQTFKVNLDHVVGASVATSSATATIAYAQMVMHDGNGDAIPTSVMASPGATYFIVGDQNDVEPLDIKAFDPSMFQGYFTLDYNSDVIGIFPDQSCLPSSKIVPNSTEITPSSDTQYFIEALNAGHSTISLSFTGLIDGVIQTIAAPLALGAVTDYHPQLKVGGLDGTAVSQDVNNPTSDEIIGQSYSFVVTGAQQATTLSWHLPAFPDKMMGYFSGSRNSGNPVRPRPTQASADSTQRNLVKGVWVQAGNQQVSVDVTINGQVRILTGFFNVIGPNNLGATLTTYKNNHFGITSDAYPQQSPTSQYVEFGTAPYGVPLAKGEAAKFGGVKWDANGLGNQVAAQDNKANQDIWDYAWVQTIVTTLIGIEPPKPTIRALGAGLDQSFPYEAGGPSGDGPGFVIEPGQTVINFGVAKTWLMVKAKEQPDSSYVPVASVNWGFFLQASYSNAVKFIGVILPGTSQFSQTSQFPIWTSYARDYKYFH